MSAFSHLQYAERLARAARDEAFSLEEHLSLRPHLDPAHCRVIKRGPKLHLPQLKLADYIEEEVALPSAVHRAVAGDGGPLSDVLGNDAWGDCGEAMAIHGVEAFHLDANTFVPQFVTGDALTAYSESQGFDPNDGPPGQNPTDQGTDNGKLVAYWQDTGIPCAADGSRHKIAGSLALDLGNDYLSRLAIWEFVALFRAVGLPVSAQGKTLWRHPKGVSLAGDNAIGSWGYHDIPYLSYDQHYMHADSWGADILVGYGWDHAYAVGGFVVITQEQTNLQGISPAGVNWTKLNADFRALSGSPVQ
jgi:hypothetical protein